MNETATVSTTPHEPGAFEKVRRGWGGLRLRSRITGLFLLVFVCSIAFVTYASVRAVRGAIIEGEYARFNQDAELILTRIGMHVVGARRGVLSLAGTRDARTMLESGDRGAINRIRDRYVALLESKPDYRSCRVIDADGMERIRIDRLGSESPVVVIPESEYQDKSHRNYFIEGIRTPAGDVAVSPIDLNREFGELEVPHVPVMRVSSVVVDDAGNTIGLVILNVNLTIALAEVRSASRPGLDVFLLNSDGDFLVHPDRSLEFAFEFREPDRVSEAVLDAAESGETYTHNGEKRLYTSVHGTLAGARGVTLLLDSPYGVLVAPANAVTRTSLAAAIPIASLGIVLAFWFARSLTRPLEALTGSANRFHTGARMFDVPESGGLEVRELGRSLKRMIEALEAHTRSIEEGEARFRTRVDSAPNGILLVSKDGTIVLVNRAIEGLFGYTREELVGN